MFYCFFATKVCKVEKLKFKKTVIEATDWKSDTTIKLKLIYKVLIQKLDTKYKVGANLTGAEYVNLKFTSLFLIDKNL